MRKNLQAACLNCEKITDIFNTLKGTDERAHHSKYTPMSTSIDPARFLTMKAVELNELEQNCALILEMHAKKMETWIHVESWVPKRLPLIEISAEDLLKWEKRKESYAKYRTNKKLKLSQSDQEKV